MEKDLMKLLAKDDVEVYVVIGGLTEDQLFINHNDEMLRITRSSGEYENDFGQFMLRTNLTKDQLKAAKKTMKTLADPKSIKPMEHVGMIKFELKPIYMDKLIKLDNQEHKEVVETFKNLEKKQTYKILNDMKNRKSKD